MVKLKYILAVYIFSFFVLPCYAVDLTSEVILSAVSAKKSEASSDISGRIFLKLLDKKNIVSDIHYQYEDSKHRLNVAYVKFLKGKFDLVVGRQLMAWGSGYNFNPTDIFNSKPLGAAFDPVYYKTGRDAVTLTSYHFGAMTDFVYAAGYSIENEVSSDITIDETGKEDFGLRIKKNVSDFDIALSYTKLGEREFEVNGTEYTDNDDNVFGVSIKGSIPKIDWGIWLEAARFNDQEKDEFVTGLEYIYDRWTFNCEYYYNGFGSKNKANYDVNLLFKGRTLGVDYIVPSASYLFSEKLTITGFVFSNLNDSSTIIGSVADYFYNDIIEIAILPFAVFGDSSSEYGSQKESVGDFGVQGLIKLAF
ncbi:MAG: hypothetical protein JW871_07560 [Endomicrobiales bacterium]|nr:hypothetical protein [Endomicrobiales bacterium]